MIVGMSACSEATSSKDTTEISYGKNAATGQMLDVKGNNIYFETYGNKAHQALVLIHGNGGSIEGMHRQIDYFKDDYFIVVADNRAHGKSEGKSELTYDLMTEDYVAIINYLELDSVYVLGHSDGGIIGLIMAMDYPEKISKLVTAVPNLVTDSSAIVAWELEMPEFYSVFIDSMIASNNQNQDWQKLRMHLDLIQNEPNIAFSELAKIKCPVLVMTSDDDIIKPRHILTIYENIPNAHLFIMPGATHFMIEEKPELYNQIGGDFLAQPFKRPTSEETLLELIKNGG